MVTSSTAANAKRLLRQIAAEQYGCFSNAQAADAGVRRQQLAMMRANGELESVHVGVNRFLAVPTGWHGDVMAAVLAAGVDSVASYDTALALYGFSGVPLDGGIEVCSPTLWHPRRLGIRVHQTRDLPACDRTSWARIPVTTAARTLIDLAARRDRIALTALVDEAVCARLATRSWLYRRATVLRNGRSGVGIIVGLTHPGAEGEFRSWLERTANSMYRVYGVPAPRWNVPIHDEYGRIGIVDCLWPRPLIVELEGLRFHTTPAQRRNDAQRYNRLSGQARLLRFTWRDVVEEPAAMASQILAALGR